MLLLDTDTVERSADSMGVLIDWPGEAAFPQKFAFLVSESRPPACAVQALAAEQAARQREELNALYVALTRARHTLVISSIEPHRETTDSWWQRLQKLADQLPVPALETAAAPAAEIDSSVFYLPTLPTLLPAEVEVSAPSVASPAASIRKRIASPSSGSNQRDGAPR